MITPVSQLFFFIVCQLFIYIYHCIIHRIKLYYHFEVSDDEKYSHTMILPPPCFTLGMVLTR